MQRILIAGGPRTGKTTLANSLGIARHTDDLIGTFDWSAASAEVATWIGADGPWIIEGVAVSRALRKWLVSHPEGKPCDRIHHLTMAHETLTPGQLTMTKGCATVWREVRESLAARGVEIIESVEPQTIHEEESL